MPHHPTEEHAPSGLTDKVAAQSKDSTASDHPLHDENKGPQEQATIQDIQAGNRGPQVPEGQLPEAKGKEELQAAAKKLNSD